MEIKSEQFYALIGLLAILLAVVIVIFVYNFKLSQYFTNRRFTLSAKYKIEPINKVGKFKITINNNNLNDTRVTGFGFIYRNQTIDYFKTYMMNKEVEDNTSVAILSRESISLEIDVEDLKGVILEFNRNTMKMKGIKTYVTEAQGATYKKSAKDVKKKIKFDFNQKIAGIKAEEKRLKGIAKTEAKEERAKDKERKKEIALAQKQIKKEKGAIKGMSVSETKAKLAEVKKKEEKLVETNSKVEKKEEKTTDTKKDNKE